MSKTQKGKKRKQSIHFETVLQLLAFLKGWPAPSGLVDGTVFSEEERKLLKQGLDGAVDAAIFWCAIRDMKLKDQKDFSIEMKKMYSEVMYAFDSFVNEQTKEID